MRIKLILKKISSYNKRIFDIISYSSKLLLLNLKLKFNQKNVANKSALNNKSILEIKENSIYAFFDLHNVITFDLISWLLYLRALSNNKKVYLLVLPKLNDDEFFIDISKEKKFLKNKSIQFRYYTIFKPLLDLIENFNVTIIFFKDRSESKNFFNLPNEQKYPSSAEDGSLIEFKSKYIELTNFKKKHGYIPSLKAPESYLEIVNLFLKNKNILHKKIVTISLRVCSYGLERNSIIKNWIEIYEWLKNKNYQPVFINDLENLDSFSNFKFEEKYLTFDIATTDCRARLAIYENSFFNLAVDSGFSALLQYSKYCKFLIFKVYSDNLTNCNDKFYLDNFNISHGEQLNHFNHFQKIIWEIDSVSIVKKEFLLMEKLLEEI
jgi:hypothetical protein